MTQTAPPPPSGIIIITIIMIMTMTIIITTSKSSPRASHLQKLLLSLIAAAMTPRFRKPRFINDFLRGRTSGRLRTWGVRGSGGGGEGGGAPAAGYVPGGSRIGEGGV